MIQNLVTKYPKIFSIVKYLECGDGWYTLIDELCHCLQHNTDNNQNQPQVVASCVKEKYGGLRFYTDGGTDYAEGMITFAEHMSYSICEMCGNPGKPEGGWISTLCEPCREKKNV